MSEHEHLHAIPECHCMGCREARVQGLWKAAKIVEDYAQERFSGIKAPTPSDDIVAALKVAAQRVRKQAEIS